jgi:hypothetical protein
LTPEKYHINSANASLFFTLFFRFAGGFLSVFMYCKPLDHLIVLQTAHSDHLQSGIYPGSAFAHPPVFIRVLKTCSFGPAQKKLAMPIKAGAKSEARNSNLHPVKWSFNDVCVDTGRCSYLYANAQ